MAQSIYVIGIDAGGTKIRGVLIRGNTVIKRAEALHGVMRPSKKVFTQTLYTVLDRLVRKNINGIGIGLPGVIANNRVVGAGNVKALTGLNIKKIVGKKYRAKVRLDNDVKAALRAEVKRFPKYKSIFMLTLGTGIGGAWWRNNEIMKGSFGTAYELGQMVLDKQRNHFLELEDFCARKFFKAKALDPLASEMKARAGNKQHKELWRQFGEHLGIALANVVNFIEPELIIVGGGMAHAWPLFAPTATRTMKRFTLSRIAKRKVKLARPRLGKWGGALGAAMLTKQK